ncbi:ABC transporter substrate-binding protein [Ideonella sp. A 288]|uniref:ABC transporter substrate-binding protein n=1 Tax=Ideonella sp. A 288 TaxID=1962181 RepID=UPI000B4A5708|nr:ABC transporter substrate-binding protein [Ideonella sp. A 288]
MKFHRRTLAALALAAGATFVHTGAIAQANVLRIVPHSNLAILDPIWTTAYMSRNHGYMVYDTLFGTDEKNQIKPQMVESWTESADHRLWTFKLRKGLEFHDGKPVTSEDVVASLQRWGKRDAMGSALMQFVQRMDTPAPDTFRIFLGEACGFVLEALGKPSSNVPFIMPKRIADTDAFKQIEEHIGSGPYVFKKDEFKPGDKAVYTKFAKYVPRSEPPSGTTGGKRVYVDRVEWNLALRDAQAQVNALQKGEVDIIEQLSFDHYETVKADPKLQIPRVANLGLQYMARFNHLHKPFDNPKVRQAALAAFAQEPFLRAQVGVKELYRTCPGMFMCGTPYGSAAGSDIQSKSNMKKAQELLKASGYDGTPVVLMKPTDLAAIQKLPDVAAQLLRQAGFKVDLQAMDWQTLVGRRAKKDAPDKGGWNMLITGWQAHDIWNPISNPTMDTRGEKSGWFGWAKDDALMALRDQFLRATDEPAKKKLADAIQTRAFEIGTHAPLGEVDVPLAAGRQVSGFFVSNGHLYWNLKKQ